MEISIAAEPLFHIGHFVVTNSLFLGIIVSLILAFLLVMGTRRLALVPRGGQNVLEVVFEGLLALMDSVTQDRGLTKKFFPLIATIFLFVLFSNWFGLLPGGGTLGLNHETADGHHTIVPFLRSPSADLNFTLALSLIVVITTQVTGILGIGLWKYGGKFFVSPLRKPFFIGTLVGLLELVSEFAKLLSFSFRLFGNIFAGEVLLIVMLHLFPYFLPLPFLFFETFVGVIQAGVFALLTLVFLKMSTMEAEH